MLFSQWPSDDILQKIESFPVALDGGGKELVDSLILGTSNPVVLEVGVFLGGSAIRWLGLDDSVSVIGVDPYGDGWEKIIQRYQDQNLPWMKKVLDPIPDVEALKGSLVKFGSLNCVFANLQNYRDRFFAVQAGFESVCAELAEQVSPDIIYLDADKSYDMLELSREYFPNAVLCGDDWTWGEAQGFPIQQAVKKYCSKYNCDFRFNRVTWVIEPRD